MRFFIALSLIRILLPHSLQAQVEEREARKEIKKLDRLKAEVEALLEEKRKVLQKIKEESEKLKKEREALEKLIEEARAERYKKLAKVFEKMDPELAGQKISKFTDPKEAAYIIYNMKERKAGQVMNYIDPEMVDKIVRILTDIKLKDRNRSSP